MSWVTELARPEIVALKPYSHAVWEPHLERLHANELPWRPPGDNSMAGLNRYPEPQPRALIERLAALYATRPECVLAGRGSDEAIDLLLRTFCRPREDAVLVCPPTFGMYAVGARIQGAEVKSVELEAVHDFALDSQALLAAATESVKLVFLCSPNNPTGTLLAEAAVLEVARALGRRALLVVDEAYIEFAGVPSLIRHIDALPQLAILRTLSKAYGLAGARLGSLIAHPEIIALLRKVIPPYAISQPTVEIVQKQLEPPQLAVMRARVAAIQAERERLAAALAALPRVLRVWPSAANFLLVEHAAADRALACAHAAGLLIRDVRAQPGLARAVRISVGTAEQNARLLEALR